MNGMNGMNGPLRAARARDLKRSNLN